MKSFFKNPIKVLIIGLPLLVILLLAGFFVYQLYISKTVAIVGDQKITLGQYRNLLSKEKKVGEYTDNEDVKNNPSGAALDDLILEKALEIEAKKRNIVVTDSEINEEYKTVIEPYKDEEEFKETIKNAYDWTPELAKRAAKIRILQKKLKPYLISARHILGVFVRWDWAGNNISQAREREVRDLSYQKINSLLPLMQRRSLTEGDIRKTLYEIQKDETWAEPVTGTLIFDDLNPKTAPDTFVAKEDWEAIAKLKKFGDTTGIIKSGGGYYAVYQLKKTNEGSFNSWEEFLESYKKKASIYALDYHYLIAKKKLRDSFQTAFFNFKAKIAQIFKPKTAEAGKIICSRYHFGQFTGRIYDPVNNAWVGNVKLYAHYGSIGTWPKCYSPQEAAEDTKYSDTSGTVGNFVLGTMKDPSKLKLSCWVRWDVRLTKTGFYPIFYNEVAHRANGVSTNLDNHPFRGGRGYSGDYGGTAASPGENRDNDGLLYMRPKPVPNERPTAHCVSPKEGAKIAQGQGFYLRGSAIDPEEDNVNVRGRYRTSGGSWVVGAPPWGTTIPSGNIYNIKGLNQTATPLASGSYVWQVQGKDAVSGGSWTNDCHFSIEAPPNNPPTVTLKGIYEGTSHCYLPGTYDASGENGTWPTSTYTFNLQNNVVIPSTVGGVCTFAEIYDADAPDTGDEFHQMTFGYKRTPYRPDTVSNIYEDFYDKGWSNEFQITDTNKKSMLYSGTGNFNDPTSSWAGALTKGIWYEWSTAAFDSYGLDSGYDANGNLVAGYTNFDPDSPDYYGYKDPWRFRVNQKPTITLSPAVVSCGDNCKSSAYLSATGSDADDDPVTVYIDTNGDGNAEASGTGNASYTWSNLASGTYSWRAKACDNVAKDINGQTVEECSDWSSSSFIVPNNYILSVQSETTNDSPLSVPITVTDTKIAGQTCSNKVSDDKDIVAILAATLGTSSPPTPFIQACCTPFKVDSLTAPVNYPSTGKPDYQFIKWEIGQFVGNNGTDNPVPSNVVLSNACVVDNTQPLTLIAKYQSLYYWNFLWREVSPD